MIFTAVLCFVSMHLFRGISALLYAACIITLFCYASLCHIYDLPCIAASYLYSAMHRCVCLCSARDLFHISVLPGICIRSTFCYASSSPSILIGWIPYSSSRALFNSSSRAEVTFLTFTPSAMSRIICGQASSNRGNSSIVGS